MTNGRTTAIVAVTLLAGAAVAMAKPQYLNAWEAKYAGPGGSTLPERMADLLGSECYVCHHPPNLANEGNCYRLDIRDELDIHADITLALDNLDGEDSDGDGVPNGVEIMAVRDDDPLQVGYNPGLTGPMGIDPCGDPPDEVVTGVLETPVVACPGDTNGDGLLNIDDIVNAVICFGNPTPDCAGPGTTGDIDDGSGTGTPDGLANIDDIVYAVLRFGSSCP